MSSLWFPGVTVTCHPKVRCSTQTRLGMLGKECEARLGWHSRKEWGEYGRKVGGEERERKENGKVRVSPYITPPLRSGALNGRAHQLVERSAAEWRCEMSVKATRSKIG